MKKTLLLVAMLFAVTQASAKDYQIISKLNENNITFYKCDSGSCSSLGDEEGYEKDDFSYHPNFRRVGNGILFVAEGLGVLIAGGVTAGVPVVGAGLAAGFLTWLNYGQDSGPIDGFQMASMASDLNDLKESDEETTVIVDTDSYEEFAESLIMLEELLTEI